MPYDSKSLLVITEAFLSQATGPGASGALYLQPWFYYGLKPRGNITGEAVYFAYVPISGAAVTQHVIERAKLEYMHHPMKFGVGYGAYALQHGDWQHRPFFTTTFSTRKWGDIEMWLQRLIATNSQSGAWQLQLRYALSVKR